MMKRDKRKRSYQFSHMLILVSYTVLATALIGESFLLGWETWPLVPIGLSIPACWVMHIRKTLSDTQRIWTYSIVMMCTFFYYGNHVTSTYDLAMTMVAIIMLFTTTGETGLVKLAVATYYVTLAFDLHAMGAAGTDWDSLLITRTLLHVAVVFLVGWVADIIIREWAALFYASDERLGRLNEVTGRMNVFMANLSHELRTPLNLILGISDGLDGTEEADRLRRDMQTIHEAGRRMEVQTDDILNYSELAMGSLAVNARPSTLSSVLNDLVCSLRPIPAKLELVIDVDPQTPAVLVTDADKLKKILWHIVSNSLKYSVEGGVYVRIGCVRREYGVNLLLEVTDTGVGMTEEELESVNHQFYSSDSSNRVHAGGLGIGLCITGGFVRAMGGFMGVSSEVGVGTTVKVSIPMAVEDGRSCMRLRTDRKLSVCGCLDYFAYPDPRVREYYNAMLKNIVSGLGITVHRAKTPADVRKVCEEHELTHLFVGEAEYRSDPELFEGLARKMTVAVVARDASALPAGSRAHLLQKPFYCFPMVNVLEMSASEQTRAGKVLRYSGVRALVVDDEPMNLQVAANILGRYGIDVTSARSGMEAVVLCADLSFDVIFMDHMMPEVDGIEAMRQIRLDDRGRNGQTPIVMLTANTLSTSRDLFERAGADGFVGKPVDVAALERVLRRVLPGAAAVPLATHPTRTAAPKPTATQALAALGIDVAVGVRYCGGDEEFYLDLMSQFADEATGKADALDRFFEARDYKGYCIAVHALKSTSKMVGANRLSEVARRLEEAAKNEDARAFEGLHPRLMTAYGDLAADIRSVLGTKTRAAEGEILEFPPDGEVRS